MAYSKNMWKSKDKITKEKLNSMENGIYEAHNELEKYSSQIEETMSQLEQKVNKGEFYINIKNLGAKGDGITDDTDAFKNALSMNKNIYIPNGTYIISEQISITNPVNIIGEKEDGGIGYHARLKSLNNSIFKIGNTRNVCIENICLENNGDNISIETKLENSNSAHECIINNCVFYGGIGIKLEASCGFVINNCRFWTCRIGVKLERTANFTTISNSSFLHFKKASDCNCCINIDNTDGVNINSIWTEKNDIEAIKANNSSGISVNTSWFEHENGTIIDINSLCNVEHSGTFSLLNSNVVTNDTREAVIKVNANCVDFNSVRFAHQTLHIDKVKIDLMNSKNVTLQKIVTEATDCKSIEMQPLFLNGCNVQFLDRNISTYDYTENLQKDSSFVKNDNFVPSNEDVIIKHITNKGIYDNYSYKFILPPNSNVRNKHKVTFSKGESTNLSLWLWSDEDFVDVTIGVSGETQNIRKTITITKQPQKYSFSNICDGDGSYYLYIYNTNSSKTISINCDDVMITKGRHNNYIVNNSTSKNSKYLNSENVLSNPYINGLLLSSSENMPSYGKYNIGDYITNLKCNVENIIDGKSFYIKGWLRVTDGDTHIEGEDWIVDKIYK